MSYVVAVRTLCEFTAKRGDLDLRFTPSPTAQDGVAGHTLVAERRPEHYESEITLEGNHGALRVRGRADGFDPRAHRLEEVKTYRGDLARMPANHRSLHWAQVKIYGWLMCETRGLAALDLALVYFDIAKQDETVLVESHSAESLRLFFEDQCEAFVTWAEQELVHRRERDARLAALAFPHVAFRDGQRQLAEAVYRSASAACSVMVQAPTGIGKTVGTLFPLLKACPSQKIDKIFFLTAKTSGRAMALDALDVIGSRTPDLPLRVLELTARDKACEHRDKACHGESCPLARGFYDRLGAARTAAARAGRLDLPTLRRIALEYEVCPYFLGQAMVPWSDVIVGDYNYYFDTRGMLYGQMLTAQWRVGVLVDEAHNLLERARKMYSAELDQNQLKAAREWAPAPIKKLLDKVQRGWNALNKAQPADYQVHEQLPDKLVAHLQQAMTAITEHMVEQPVGDDDALLPFYFDALHFLRIAELFDESSLFDVTLHPSAALGVRRAGSVLALRNIVPGPFLAPRYAAAHSMALFSATLSPYRFYGDVLGLPKSTPWIEVASPFKAAQLEVRVVNRISTRYQHRERSLLPIVELMAEQYRRRPGNYLTFFSSFDYLQKAIALLRTRHPDIPVWEQARGMEESAQHAFLARFTPTSRGVGFAVLGGSFAEGVDLPGDRLIGAFIATLGLPQVNPVNEHMMRRLESRFGSGYDYVYLYPGLQKVVQAAGRVIRTQSDEGVVYLIDDRYDRADVRRLLPGWWSVGTHRPGPIAGAATALPAPVRV